MGMWGPGLYEDDTAADLKNTMALAVKGPVSGEALLKILCDINGAADLDDVDGQAFWLVVADQFERRGIPCREATKTALSILADGRNLKCLEELGADQQTLKKRAKVLGELSARLQSPRPPKPRPTPKKPPDMILAAGEVYAFPTMEKFACHPWRAPSEGPFVANGWGALVVLETGRAFDWLPWCAVASLTVDPERKPSLHDALAARLIFHLQTEGAARCVPRRAEIRKMNLERLGSVALDASKTKEVVSKWSVSQAIECGWSISYAGYARGVQGPPVGCQLSRLIAPASAQSGR
jgi:hypothetical protein